MTPEGWSRRRIGAFAQRVKRQNTEALDLEPLSVTKYNGVVRQSEKYKKRIATDPVKYVIAQDGDFAFDPMSLYYGAIGLVRGVGRGLISPDYVSFATDTSVHDDFLDKLLRFPEMHKVYESLSETGNSFGKRRRLYWSVFENIELALPPLPEQRKIADILSSVDDAIEATQAVIDQLQVVKKAMMAELLTRGLPGRHTRFKQTEIGEVPEEWEVVRLGDVCEQKPRYGANVPKGPYSLGGIRYVRITDIDSDGRLASDSLAGISAEQAEGYHLTMGDVVIARSGATVGKSYVYRREDGPCAHAGYLIRFRPAAGRIIAPFVGNVLQSERYWAWVRESQRAGAQPNINAAEYSSFPVPVPSLDEQNEIVAAVDAIDDRMVSEHSALQAMNSTKSALLSVLLTGEVRVTPDPEGA